jgi:hypothetical protein
MASKAWKLAMSLLLGSALYCAAPAQQLRAAEPAGAKPAGTAPQRPAQAAPPADDDLDLLEFLGSIDAANEDQDWLEFLKNTDIGKVARAKTPVTLPEGRGK